MEEQTLQTEAQPTRDEALSWQFILVLVVIAALIPLLASSFISSVERAERPPAPAAVAEPLSAEAIQGLAELPLTQTYADPSGIAIQYPESWHVLPLNSGFFVLSNYELDLNATEFPPDIILVQVQRGLLNTFTLPDGSVPEPGTSPQAIMETLVSDSPDPIAVSSRTVDDLPAASLEIVGQGSARELVMVAPNDAELVLIDSSMQESLWAGAQPLVERMVASMTFEPVGE